MLYEVITIVIILKVKVLKISKFLHPVMKWSFKFLTLAGIAVLILSCANPDAKNIKNQEKKFSLEQLKWLPGKWVNITDEFEFYETWEHAGNTSFTGESYMLIDGDTVFYEVLRLEESDDSVKYIVGVARITSYNVCYTKLLRGLLKARQHLTE